LQSRHIIPGGIMSTGVLITDDYQKYRALMPAGDALISPNTTAKN